MAWCLLRRIKFLKKYLYKQYSMCNFPDLDIGYYCNNENLLEIKNNIRLRKGVGDIDKVLNAYSMLKSSSSTDSSYMEIQSKFYRELSYLPNKTHPLVKEYYDEPRLVSEVNKKRDFGSHSPLEFSEITRRLNLMRTSKLGNTCGHKSYFFMGELAELEEALIKYTISFLLKNNFELVSVPDILHSDLLERCGMTVNYDRTQIYTLDPVQHGSDLCLSGTAEMSLAGLLTSTTHNKTELPMKLAAVSRCYRAETSNVVEERGIYRVHQFTKVEMFAVTNPKQSDDMLEYIRKTQETLFASLGIHFRVLDMPPHELGAPAYRKYDIEAWMPGRNNYGEISSCSNCTDYQSRRLNIRNKDNDKFEFVHTLNGTACAIPRVLIAILETNQEPNGKIIVPDVLQPFMGGKQYITRNISIPELKLVKIKK